MSHNDDVYERGAVSIIGELHGEGFGPEGGRGEAEN